MWFRAQGADGSNLDRAMRTLAICSAEYSGQDLWTLATARASHWTPGLIPGRLTTEVRGFPEGRGGRCTRVVGIGTWKVDDRGEEEGHGRGGELVETTLSSSGGGLTQSGGGPNRDPHSPLHPMDVFDPQVLPP